MKKSLMVRMVRLLREWGSKERVTNPTLGRKGRGWKGFPREARLQYMIPQWVSST